MLGQPLLELFRRLNLDLLAGRVTPNTSLLARLYVTRRDASVLLGLVVVLDDARSVLVEDVAGDTFHAEDFDIEALAVRQGIFDLCEGFLVDLVHVHGETAGSVETTSAAVAFKVLRLLVRDQKLEILKVSFAVVAPGAREDVLDVGVGALLFSHLADDG
jgi:hypothetical protein